MKKTYVKVTCEILITHNDDEDAFDDAISGLDVISGDDDADVELLEIDKYEIIDSK